MNVWFIVWLKLLFVNCISTGLRCLLYWNSFSLLSMITMTVQHVTNHKEIVCYIYPVRKIIHLFKQFVKMFKHIYICYLLDKNLLPKMVHLIIILIVIHFIIFSPTYLMIIISHLLIFIFYLTIRILFKQLRHFILH